MSVRRVVSPASRVSAQSSTIRVSVPPLVVEVLQLEHGDGLEWSVDLAKERVTVRRAKTEGSSVRRQGRSEPRA